MDKNNIASEFISKFENSYDDLGNYILDAVEIYCRDHDFLSLQRKIPFINTPDSSFSRQLELFLYDQLNTDEKKIFQKGILVGMERFDIYRHMPGTMLLLMAIAVTINEVSAVNIFRRKCWEKWGKQQYLDAVKPENKENHTSREVRELFSGLFRGISAFYTDDSSAFFRSLLSLDDCPPSDYNICFRSIVIQDNNTLKRLSKELYSKGWLEYQKPSDFAFVMDTVCEEIGMASMASQLKNFSGEELFIVREWLENSEYYKIDSTDDNFSLLDKSTNEPVPIYVPLTRENIGYGVKGFFINQCFKKDLENANNIQKKDDDFFSKYMPEKILTSKRAMQPSK